MPQLLGVTPAVKPKGIQYPGLSTEGHPRATICDLTHDTSLHRCVFSLPDPPMSAELFRFTDPLCVIMIGIGADSGPVATEVTWAAPSLHQRRVPLPLSIDRACLTRRRQIRASARKT